MAEENTDEDAKESENDEDTEDYDDSEENEYEEVEETESDEEVEQRELSQLIQLTKEYIGIFFSEDIQNPERLKRLVEEQKEYLAEDIKQWNLKNEQLIDRLKLELIASLSACAYSSVIHSNNRKTIKQMQEQLKGMDSLKQDNLKKTELIVKLKADFRNYYDYTTDQVDQLEKKPEGAISEIRREDIAILRYLSDHPEGARFNQMSVFFKETRQLSEPTLAKHLNLVLPRLGYIIIRQVKDGKIGRTVKLYSISEKGKTALQSYLK